MNVDAYVENFQKEYPIQFAASVADMEAQENQRPFSFWQHAPECNCGDYKRKGDCPFFVKEKIKRVEDAIENIEYLARLGARYNRDGEREDIYLKDIAADVAVIRDLLEKYKDLIK